MDDRGTDQPDTKQTPEGTMGDSVDGPRRSGANEVRQYAVDQGDIYNMSNSRRGVAIIINQRDFDPSTEMNSRSGTDADADSLESNFYALGFTPVRHNNVTASMMLKIFAKAGRMDHSDADCFACAILSHGEEGVVYGTDGIVQLDKLIEPFKGNKCESLRGKPKWFIVQACRGQKFDEGVEVTDDDGEGMDETDANTVHRIPSEADFLMCYSVVPGYFSWRNSTRGSWFVQALCTVLERHAEDPNYDILRLMTRVNKMVAYDFESKAAREFMNRKKQIPSIVSMLTKEFYLTPKH